MGTSKSRKNTRPAKRRASKTTDSISPADARIGMSAFSAKLDWICELDQIIGAIAVTRATITREAPGDEELMAAEGCLRMPLRTAHTLRDAIEHAEPQS